MANTMLPYILPQLSNATEEQQVQNVAMRACDALLECGFTKPLSQLKFNDACQLINSAALHIFY